MAIHHVCRLKYVPLTHDVVKILCDEKSMQVETSAHFEVITILKHAIRHQ